jgi:hypothetical protein
MAKTPNDRTMNIYMYKISICMYVQIFSFASPSKKYPNWDFWYENIPSGNPDYKLRYKNRCNLYLETLHLRSMLCFSGFNRLN